MNEETKILKMPKGIQSFEEIRNGGYIYVDKTDYVWKIANGNKYNFLGRPRRFGKSLLADTLKCYFEGRQDLFQHLKIMNLEQTLENQWVKRAVLKFDFSGPQNADQLTKKLNNQLVKYENIYGRTPSAETPGDRLQELILRAYAKTEQQVAVIVDEYDAPLQNTLFNDDEYEKTAEIYRNFFPTLKENGLYLKCLFLTGVTKFTSLSLFSTLNTVSILGYLPDYASALGLSRQEIIDNFQPQLQEMAAKMNQTEEEVIAQMKDMYDGYHFSDDTTQEVYNPFSVINALSDKNISNYWVASGATKLLYDIIKRSDVKGIDFDNCYIRKTELQLNDVSVKNVKLFLYQSGYLTINYYNNEKERYYLRIPNKEVRETLYEIVLANAVNNDEYEVSSAIGRMQDAIDDDDMPSLFDNLAQLVSETPYITGSGDKDKLYERDFRFILRCAFYLCGCRIEEERQTSKGRIDLVAHSKNIIIIMELKLSNNGGLEAAKKQLVENNYASAFSAEGKKIYQVALSFDTEKRGISGYDVCEC